jgi:hypothetical protein
MSHIEPRVYPEWQYREIGAFRAWNILLDIHNAVLYGFAGNRLPEPGKSINVAEAEAHVVNIQKEWEAEARGRDLSHEWTGSPPFTSMPQNAKLYLHEILQDAKQTGWRENDSQSHWIYESKLPPGIKG